MDDSVKRIFDVIKEYQNDIGTQITEGDIMNWGNQFGDEAMFVLTEFARIIEKTYLSKEQATILIKKRLESLRSRFGIESMADFIKSAYFFDTQDPNKSQSEIIGIVKTVLNQNFGVNYDDYLSFPKSNFFYFDDISATGGTLFKDLSAWLKSTSGQNRRIDQVLTQQITLTVSCFCIHTFAWEKLRWRLKMDTNVDGIQYLVNVYADLWIEDHTRFNDQIFNCVIPLEHFLSTATKAYFNQLSANRNSIRAFRPLNRPKEEKLFSGKENRIKFENIITSKGVKILAKVSELGDYHRPLGVVPPSYKTLETGTLFFTWRNIPNNSPIVFWWNNHGWKPLFPLQNRGKS